MGIPVGKNGSSKLVSRPWEQNGTLLLLPLCGHVDMLDTQTQHSHLLYVLWRVGNTLATCPGLGRGEGKKGLNLAATSLWWTSLLTTQKHFLPCLPDLSSWKDSCAPAIPVAWSHLLLFLPCFLYIALKQLPHYTSTSHKGLVNFSHRLVLPQLRVYVIAPPVMPFSFPTSKWLKSSPAFPGATQTRILHKALSDHPDLEKKIVFIYHT